MIEFERNEIIKNFENPLILNKGYFNNHRRALYTGGAKKGVVFSEHHKKAISSSLKGKTRSKDAIEKARQSLLKTLREKGRKPVDAEVRKLMSEKRKGCHHWTDGKVDKYQKECPGEGWVLGRPKKK